MHVHSLTREKDANATCDVNVTLVRTLLLWCTCGVEFLAAVVSLLIDLIVLQLTLYDD